ncbi:hypothetical protein [Glutamicibacter ardleyensis]|uniref:hypothetical protein n=1 Tax=Glutamicibacter ardleyensis TaxID=225894 RepID=UPI003FD1EADD
MAQKTSANDVKTHARRIKALQLRAARLTYQQIADRLYNGDRGNCYRDIQKAMSNQEKEAVNEVRAQEILLLDELARPQIKKALETGDDKAVTAVLRIMERRAKYLGLDAPTQVEQTGSGGFAVLVSQDMLPEGADLGAQEASEEVAEGEEVTQ